MKGSWWFFATIHRIARICCWSILGKGGIGVFRAARFNWINMAQIHAMTPLHASPELFEPIQTARWQHVKVNIWANILAALPRETAYSGIFFFKVDCFLVTSWKVKLRSMISGQMKWSSPKKLQHWVHFCSQIWSNHFCHTSGNLYHISDKNAYRPSKSQHSSVTSIFFQWKNLDISITKCHPNIHQTPRCIGPANKNLYWRVQTKIPEKKERTVPVLLEKIGSSIQNSLETTNSLKAVFGCSRNKSLVQILSLEISWDQVPFSKMVLSWRTFAYPVCPLWNWQKVPENRPHPKRNCSSWLW